MYPADSIFRAVLWRATGGRVAKGPFAGLLLAPRPFLPHLLGTYERELHDHVERLAVVPWDTIVNVGGGNGLYIAGLGRRAPAARLVVFELNAEARAVIAATVARNGLTGRTTILGEADPTNLEPSLAGGTSTLVVMDVEGAEIPLTDPAVAPSLRRATMLIETHDVIVPGCREAIVSRYGATHRITAIPTRPRTVDDFPSSRFPTLRRWFPRQCVDAVQEWRGGPQEWLLLEPH